MRSPAKILLISEYFPPRIFGGGEISAERLARSLSDRGLDITVLTSGAEDLQVLEKEGGFEIVRLLRTGRSPNSVKENVIRTLVFPHSLRTTTRSLAEEANYDVVFLLGATAIHRLRIDVPTVAVVNGYQPFCPKANLYFQEREECHGCGAARFAACASKSRHVGNVRLPAILRWNPAFWLVLYIQYLLRRRALKEVERYVAISGFVEDILLRHGIPQKRIMRISNVAEIEDSDQVPKELADRLKARRTVTFVGRLVPMKGVELALQGFSAWRSDSDLFLVVGSGPQRERLEWLATELGISNAVFFAGHLEPHHLPFVYRNSHAIVLPSQWPEPFSRVVMEAAYFGAPLLASDRGGNRDLPVSHLFSTPRDLADKLDDPPVPSFDPYDPNRNLGRYLALIDELRSSRGETTG